MMMTIEDLLEICEKYNDMPWVVRETLKAVINGVPKDNQFESPPYSISPSGYALIEDFLLQSEKRGVHFALVPAVRHLAEIKGYVLELGGTQNG